MNPPPKQSLTLWKVTVPVLCLVFDEFVESSLPRRKKRPTEADAVEPIDTILRKRIGPVGRALSACPQSKHFLFHWYVAVAVLCLVLNEFTESSLPWHCSFSLP